MKVGFVGAVGKGVALAGSVLPAPGSGFSTRWYFGSTLSRLAIGNYFLEVVGRTGATGATGLLTALGPSDCPLIWSKPPG